MPERLISSAPRHTRLPRAFVYTVGGEFFGYREGLSESVEAVIPELIHRIEQLIAWWEGRAATCPDLEPEFSSHA